MRADTQRACLAAIAVLVLAASVFVERCASARADSFPTGFPGAGTLVASPATLYPADGPAMETARVIAARYWHAEPCRGRVAVLWAALGPDVNAVATWSNRVGAYADPVRNRHCSVKFNSDQPFDWPSLCTVFVHEFGHLTGHQHSTDPSDVMYPVYSAPVAACVAAPPPPTGLPSDFATLRSLGRAARARREARARRQARARRHGRRAHRRHRHHRSRRAARAHRI